MKNICLIALMSIVLGAVSCSEADDPVNETVYTVTFDADGGSPIPSVQSVKSGEMAIAPTPNPAKAGYVFLFWSLGNAATAYNFQTPVTGNITLSAQWKEESTVEYWQVTWNLNGGTWPAGDNHVTQVVKGSTLVEPAAPVKTGSTFEGWYREAALTNKVTFPYDVSGVTGNFTLYAKWTTENGGNPSSINHNISSAVEWNTAIAAVNAAGNNKTHTFSITESFDLPGTSSTIFIKELAGLTVTIKGQANPIPEISLASGSTGYLIYCNKNIILENIALIGHGANTAELVRVGYGGDAELVLGSGASISGNTNTEGRGGGVFVGGKLIMKGGEISGNIAGTSAQSNGKGGGVYLPDYGELIMEDGSAISGNLACGQGGAVYVGFSAKFFMKGGEIFSNTARVVSSGGRGGGVYNSYGKFYMSNGLVTGYNIAHGDAINGVEHNPNDLSLRDSCNVVLITGTAVGNFGAALYSQVSDDNFYGIFEGETFTQTGNLGSKRERDIKVINGVLQP
ncbi:MAG: InlB B-repeat-containing protein [Tannerellaceae bacterium]|jgi:uncharacterized repeat protein (TIGR02543 family)|nr:InlB B-repeat-containing protein [Tannerellaceae bacterium]